MIELSHEDLHNLIHIVDLYYPAPRLGSQGQRIHKALAEALGVDDPTLSKRIVGSTSGGLVFANSIGYPIQVQPYYAPRKVKTGICQASDSNQLIQILQAAISISPTGEALMIKV